MESRELAGINQDLMMISILGFIQVLLNILNADKSSWCIILEYRPRLAVFHFTKYENFAGD